jgi:hypothetical protein
VFHFTHPAAFLYLMLYADGFGASFYDRSGLASQTFVSRAQQIASAAVANGSIRHGSHNEPLAALYPVRFPAKRFDVDPFVARRIPHR